MKTIKTTLSANTKKTVVPAKAGIQISETNKPYWIPAFAGMTNHGVKAIVLALAAAFALPPQSAHAAPQGGQVVAGQATIAQPNANTTTITQSTQKAIIDWQSFSIAANQHTQFIQPSAASVTLNRVVGVDPSQILGRLTANGQVFLVNPNGIYFGKNAQIDVAGLIATTHNIRNADFLAGNYNFNIAGKAGAAVINDGMIHINDTGIAAFVAPSVANRGVITARLGKIMLASANGFTLDFSGDQLIAFLVNDQVAQTAFDLQGKPLTSFVENAGQIQAQGGYVLLTAKAAETAIHSVINQTGSIEATTVGTHNGTIILNAGTSSLNVAGTLDASASLPPTAGLPSPAGGRGAGGEGNGGFIETSGAHVKIDPNAKITTAAPFGKAGTWLIDPVDFIIAATGGDMTGAQLAARLANSNIEIQTLATGTTGSGDIFVNDAVTWGSLSQLILTAHRNINVNSLINATGGGSVKLRADSLGTGVGTVNFAGTGHINANNGAAVGIYYNPVSYTDALTKSDATGNPYSNNVTLGAGAGMTAYMLVNDVNKLQAINTNLSGNYALGKNIDATATATWNAGAGFQPIGGGISSLVPTPAFLGEFSGLGHSINGLTINSTIPSVQVGLFGHSSGTVRDVSVINANVSSSTGPWFGVGSGAWTGILVGFNDNGKILNVFTSGLVTDLSGSDGSTGGLVGGNVNGIISSSGSSANVQATYNAGGLVGISSGIIQDSYATGNLSQSYYTVGGLVGINNGTILRSYATGKITGGTLPPASITVPTALSTIAGGLVGSAGRDAPSTMLNSYWDTTTSGLAIDAGATSLVATPGNGTGLTTAQMQQQTSYLGWDFVNTWQIAPNSYPTLKAFTPQPTAQIITPAIPVTPPVTPPVVTPPVVTPLPPVTPVVPRGTGQTGAVNGNGGTALANNGAVGRTQPAAATQTTVQNISQDTSRQLLQAEGAGAGKKFSVQLQAPIEFKVAGTQDTSDTSYDFYQSPVDYFNDAFDRIRKIGGKAYAAELDQFIGQIPGKLDTDFGVSLNDPEGIKKAVDSIYADNWTYMSNFGEVDKLTTTVQNYASIISITTNLKKIAVSSEEFLSIGKDIGTQVARGDLQIGSVVLSAIMSGKKGFDGLEGVTKETKSILERVIDKTPAEQRNQVAEAMRDAITGYQMVEMTKLNQSQIGRKMAIQNAVLLYAYEQNPGDFAQKMKGQSMYAAEFVSHWYKANEYKEKIITLP